MKNRKMGIALGGKRSRTASLLAATSSERYVYNASEIIVEKQIGNGQSLVYEMIILFGISLVDFFRSSQKRQSFSKAP